VIGSGVLTLVEERAEKIAGLDSLMKQTTGRTGWDYSPDMLDATAIFRLDVEKMSCKAKCI
jgi:nitroimidazol reductase NimA-like FMN-containing flavoprotein (pyridoxamine 5'-phosphate oxidase superfamily)